MNSSAPLTLAQLQDIQASCLADDVEIDLARMALWTEAEATTYFESGGETAPDSSLSEAQIRSGAYSDGRLIKVLRARLAKLGTSKPSMPGEERGGTQLTKCFVPRPEARVRLFILYGVADVVMSTEPWIRGASDLGWLEVRLVDFPGHGFRQKEALMPCAKGDAAAFDEAALAVQRAQLVRTLTDEILAAAGKLPFALYGFSFGALMAYGICLELANRRLPPPLCLCVAGRGAPHIDYLSKATCAKITCSDDEFMLKWQAAGGNFSTDNIPAHMRSRAAQLFRVGMLLGAAPSGGGQLSSPLREGAAGHMQTHEVAASPHAADPPRVGCAVLAVGSVDDQVWPDSIHGRWADVAPPGGAAGGGGARFTHLSLDEDVEHIKLMNHKKTMKAVFCEIGVAAGALAEAAEVS